MHNLPLNQCPSGYWDNQSNTTAHMNTVSINTLHTLCWCGGLMLSGGGHIHCALWWATSNSCSDRRPSNKVSQHTTFAGWGATVLGGGSYHWTRLQGSWWIEHCWVTASRDEASSIIWWWGVHAWGWAKSPHIVLGACVMKGRRAGEAGQQVTCRHPCSRTLHSWRSKTGIVVRKLCCLAQWQSFHSKHTDVGRTGAPCRTLSQEWIKLYEDEIIGLFQYSATLYRASQRTRTQCQCVLHAARR